MAVPAFIQAVAMPAIYPTMEISMAPEEAESDSVSVEQQAPEMPAMMA